MTTTIGLTAFGIAAGGIGLVLTLLIGAMILLLLAAFLMLPFICLSISGEATRTRKELQRATAELARIRAATEADVSRRWASADAPATSSA